MTTRDEIEALLRSWDAHERERGATPVIDYDFAPPSDPHVEPVAGRLEVFERLTKIRSEPGVPIHSSVSDRLSADLAYLGALLGERRELAHYVRETQGCGTAGWPDDHVTAVGNLAREQLDDLGIAWDSSTTERLEKLEGPLTVDAAPDAIRAAATEFEPAVRKLVSTDAPFTLTIETTDVDAYWAYWLDGAGGAARLRFNLRHARFTEVLARQFAIHEVLGHALQGASLAARAAREDVPWVRLLSVFAPQQVCFEGLAQALPLFVAPDDDRVIARVRVAHYTQLVRAELHLAINEGAAVHACAAYARARVPFWNDATIGDALSDQSANPLLRSYLWSYPAGLDWFAALADTAPDLGRTVLKAAYRDPLTPTELHTLWPDGPTIGGPGRDHGVAGPVSDEGATATRR